MSDETAQHEYKVTLVTAWATVITTVYARGETDAINEADNSLKARYGWSVKMWAHDVYVERFAP